MFSFLSASGSERTGHLYARHQAATGTGTAPDVVRECQYRDRLEIRNVMAELRILPYREAAYRANDAALSSFTIAVLTAAVGWFLMWEAVWEPHHFMTSLLSFCVLASIVNFLWVLHWPAKRFGEANQVTMLRAGLVCMIGSTLIADGQSPSISWHIVVLIAIALSLDFVDGYLARRFRLSSAFGARFDMEIDALLLLILSLLVWQSEQAGAWVLAIGLMRYSFVAIGWFVPSLNDPLDPSFRRKAVCALQGIALFACLLPPVDQTKASAIATFALLALITSFGIDIKALLLRETPFATTNNTKTS